VKHLVFDLGNVLFAWDPSAVALLPQADLAVDAPTLRRARQALFEGGGWQAFDAGQLSAKALALRCAQETGLPDRLYTALIEAMPESLEAMPPVLEFLSRIAPSTPCHLLSNIAGFTWERVTAQHRFTHYFQSLTLSYRVGVNKPAPALYEACFRAGAFAPEHAVFIDDRLENIQAGEALGLKGLHLPYPAAAPAALARLEAWLEGTPLEQISETPGKR